MPKQLAIRDHGSLPEWLFEAAAGGIQISGDSGSGKSVLMEQLIRTIASSDETGLLLIDPPGDLAKKLLAYCLENKRQFEGRVYYAAPGNTDIPIIPLNPLHIENWEGMTTYEREARVACKVSHAARLIQASVGGQEDFNAMPLLFKWMTRILHSLAMMGLPMADAEHFLAVGTETYDKLTSYVPDFMAQLEFEQLRNMTPKQQGELIDSTKNRFVNMFNNSVIRAHLGAVDTVPIRKLMEQRAIILVDLEPRGRLRDEDVTILSNLWLIEVLHCVFNTPESDRLPFYIFCDELPVFKASHHLISAALRQIRKMRLRFIGAHQGTHCFPGKEDDELLHSLIGQCGTRFIFRHQKDEAKFFGDLLTLPGYDPLAKKFEHYSDEQYQSHLEIWSLQDQSLQQAYGFSASEETSSSLAQSHNQSWKEGFKHGFRKSTATTDSRSHADNRANTDVTSSQNINRDMQLLTQAYGNARANMEGSTDGTGHAVQKTDGEDFSKDKGRGGSSGTTKVDASSRSKATSQTEIRGTTTKQTIVPIIKDRRVLRFIEFLTYDEQVTLNASEITRQHAGDAFMHEVTKGVIHIHVPLPRAPFYGTPMSATKRIEAYYQSLLSHEHYHDWALIEEQRIKLLHEAIRELDKLIDQKTLGIEHSPAPTSAESRPAAYLPPDCPHGF